MALSKNLCVVLAGAVLLQLASSQINLLPLGDSITFGCGSNAAPPDYWAVCDDTCGGYRLSLYENIFALALPVTFVGSVNAGPASIPAEARRNEGHPGWRIAQVTAINATWLAFEPDVITIHLGTNDIGQNHSLSSLLADMTTLLNTILKSGKVGVRVFVATILNMVNGANPQWQPAVAAYNKALPAVVAAAAANGLNVSLVDIYTETGLCGTNETDFTDCCQGNGPSSYHPDKIHPTGWGYEVMAASWWRHIKDTLVWMTAHAQ